MLLIRKSIFTILAFSTLPLLLAMYDSRELHAADLHTSFYQADTIPAYNQDSLRFPISDRRGDFVSGKGQSTYDFGTPSNIKDSVVYDAINRRYIVYEKLGSRYYRIPTTYNFDEYWQMRN